MRATLHGRVNGSATAVVGVWDPFMPSHKTLLEQLRDRAIESGSSSMAVLIDPLPGSVSGFQVRYGTSGWPVYDSVSARIRLMLDVGLDSVLLMRFRRRDFDATAAYFLDAVRAHVRLEELWLGALQLLGPGAKGAPAAVAEYADLHGFRLTMLPRAPVGTYDVRGLLASGRVVDAIKVVGRPPTWNRPRAVTLQLAWRPGQYRVVVLQRPGAVGDGVEMDVALTAQPRGPAKLIWI
jgi:FAD synthase